MFRRVYYGWWVVALCFVAAFCVWGFGVFGASVYLHAVTEAKGWSISLVSSAITLFYLTNAVSLTVVGGVIDRFGSRTIFIAGSLTLAAGVALLGRVSQPWQLYAAFVLVGLGYAVLSLTGISATIAPWFERHQGRSVAIALMGASVGAMAGVPLLVWSILHLGFPLATLCGAIGIVVVMIPLSAVILRHRSPHELGLLPDGEPPGAASTHTAAKPAAPVWSRAEAVRTSALWTVAIGFALGLVVQVGFLTHHLLLAEPLLGAANAGWLVSATGFAGLMGRMLLARVADRVPIRRYTAAIFGAQSILLALIAWFPGPVVLIGASLAYGFCLGQITTLSPIVVRREFGATGFGTIYSVAATVIQFSSAFGPALYGVLRDAFGGYPPVLAIAACFEFAAMLTLLIGRPAHRKTQPAVA